MSWLGWPIRNPITTLFLVAGSTWAYTLWIGNKARQRREEEEELVKSRMPATADELLELRALNDVPTAAIASLPAEAARVGCKEGRAPREQLVLLLRRAAAAGQPLKEEYVVERLLMAMPDAEPGSGTVDVRLATCALTFLSSGSVRERFEAIYRILGSDVVPATPSAGSRWGFGGGAGKWDEASAAAALAKPLPESIDAERLVPMLASLMATGQMPPEKMVVTEELGKNALGIARNWFEVEVSREYPAEEMTTDLLLWIPPTAQGGEGGTQSGEGAAGAESGAESRALASADASANGSESGSGGGGGGGGGGGSGGGGSGGGGGGGSSRVDLERFVEMMQSNTACVWGECYQVNERRRLLKDAAEAEEYAKNPPWYRRAWNAVQGATHAVLPTPAAATAQVPPPPEPEPPSVAASPLPPLPPVYLEDGVTPAPFVPSESFGGRREGYVFQSGAQGVGYYQDLPPGARMRPS